MTFPIMLPSETRMSFRRVAMRSRKHTLTGVAYSMPQSSLRSLQLGSLGSRNGMQRYALSGTSGEKPLFVRNLTDPQIKIPSATAFKGLQTLHKRGSPLAWASKASEGVQKLWLKGSFLWGPARIKKMMRAWWGITSKSSMARM